MLKNLKILNGILELKFNEYTYEYTITVTDDVNSLEIDYKLDEDCYLTIRDNKLDYGENIVYLDVYNVDELLTYTLYVYKENSETVSGIDTYKKTLEIANANKEIETYKVQLLTTGVFLLIVIIFSILFKRDIVKR